MPARLIDGFATTVALAEIFSDESVVGAMVDFEIALARAQAGLGMIPVAAAEAIARVERIDSAHLANEARDSASLAIPLVKALGERVGGGAAGFVHWGATSQDVVDTALVLLLKRARRIFAEDHTRLERGLRTLSEKYAGSPMLARTILQPAPPTTFGYKVAGGYGAMVRSWRGLSLAFEESIQLQFGGAAGTLASYGTAGLDLARALAKELDLPLPAAPWHAHRDRLATLIASCGVYAGSIAKMARDIALLMQPEIGELAEPGGGSSAMPNKRNPAGCVVALAASARLPGLVATFLSTMNQEQERAAGGWQSEWPTVAGAIQATGSALAAIAGVIEGLRVNTQRMHSNIEATNGAVFAEKAVMLLAAKVGRVDAQARVAEALKETSLREGLAGALTEEQLARLEDAQDYLGVAEIFRRRLIE